MNSLGGDAMKIELGATFQIKGGGYAVAWDLKSNIVEWHFFRTMSDIINDDYYDKQYWTIRQMCDYHNIRGV